MKDLTGQKFGHLTVLSHAGNARVNSWRCSCDCGGSTTRRSIDLSRPGQKYCSQSCPLKRKLNPIAEVFGSLTVVARAGGGPAGSLWQCACICGGSRVATLQDLRRGGESGCCGNTCPMSPNVKHGASGGPLYKVWSGIQQRCENPKALNAKFYNGKGVEMCARWRGDFGEFQRDMLSLGWKRGLHIHRKPRPDGTPGHYCPEDVELLTVKEHRRMHSLKYRNLTVAEWAAKKGVTPQTIRLWFKHSPDKLTL